MERITVQDDLDFSRIVYGTWRVDEDDTSPAHIQAKVEACLEQGITTMDLADIYGGYVVENIFGDCLRAAPALREKIEIVTKTDIVAPIGKFSNKTVKYYDTSPEYIEAAIETSRKEIGIDVIDLLLIHRPDPFMDHMATGAALDQAVASGKVRAVGVSNFRPWDVSLLQSAMETDLVANQVELSLSAIDAYSNGDLAFIQENQLVPMAWSPLGGGALMTGSGDVADVLDRMAGEAGVDRAAVAIAWLLAHPAKILPVMGTNKISRIKMFSDAFKVPMGREAWYELYTAALGHEVA
ncbi:MAG: aldo/keto reductase [Pseudomonadota bacterium]